MGTYRLRVRASRVGYVPEAQGGLPPGPRVPVRTGYAYPPRALGAYRVPWQPRRHLEDASPRSISPRISPTSPLHLPGATSRTPRASARSTRSARVASSPPPWRAARRRSRRARPPRASTTAWPAAARASSARAPRRRWRTCRRGLRLAKRGQRPAPQPKVPLWSAPRAPAAPRKPRTKRRGHDMQLAELASR